MRWRESRKGEQECARRTGIRRGLCLGVVSVEEEDVGVRDQLRVHEIGGWSVPKGVVTRKEVRCALPQFPASRGGQRPR